MIQGQKPGLQQPEVEAAVGGTLASWWDPGLRPALPIAAVWVHEEPDWTHTADCWARDTAWGHERDDFGGWGLGVLLVLAVAYLALGAVHAHQRGSRGRELLAVPHERHWKELAGLVSDGCAFAAAGLSRDSGPSATPDKNSGSDGSRTKKQAGKHGRKEERKTKKSSKNVSTVRGAKSLHATVDNAPLLSETRQQASESVPSAADSVAAAGGGRWVRIDQV